MKVHGYDTFDVFVNTVETTAQDGTMKRTFEGISTFQEKRSPLAARSYSGDKSNNPP
jgi:hypothetical protein